MSDELLHTLASHFRRYPAMEPIDLIKLIYQGTFGAGHLLADPEAAKRRLAEEISSLKGNGHEPAILPIGGGFIRLSLYAVGKEFSEEELFSAFLRSAKPTGKTREDLIETLRFCEENLTRVGASFPESDFSAVLEEYVSGGCPMVSHSETYRALYRPAYRIAAISELPASLVQRGVDGQVLA